MTDNTFLFRNTQNGSVGYLSAEVAAVFGDLLVLDETAIPEAPAPAPAPTYTPPTDSKNASV